MCLSLAGVTLKLQNQHFVPTCDKTSRHPFGTMSLTRAITVRINGADHAGDVDTRLLLSDFIRHSAGLTGTHVGCEQGACGACTILLDGEAVRSCLMLAVQAEGHDITTVEGLASGDGTLHPLQAAFREAHALQCGFCTPGMLMTIIPFLRDNPAPTDDDIRQALSGNLCRCTGYQHIVDAVRLAARAMTGGPAPNATW